MIYAIQSDGFVKIGFCERDPIRRLEKLQIGNPVSLKLIATFDGCKRVEADWHMRFDDLRVRGEWFRLEPKLKRALKPHLVEHDEMSRQRPVRMMEGVPMHKILAAMDDIIAADAEAQRSTP